MRDDHRLAVEGRGQRRAQPGLAVEREFPLPFGQQVLSVDQRRIATQIEIRGPEGLLACRQLFRHGGFARGQRVEVRPQRGAEEAHVTDDDLLAIQPLDAQIGTGPAQPSLGGAELEAVVLVIARHVEHAPPWRVGAPRREAAQAEVVGHQPRSGLVRADVARQHQQIDAGRSDGLEVGLALEVEVGDQLQAHGGSADEGS